MRLSGTVKFFNSMRGFGFISLKVARRTSLSMPLRWRALGYLP